jgi:sugar fermentation stimulation protein A
VELGRLVRATLVERINTYLARVTVDGAEVLAHVPNSGRLAELMVPGAAVMVRPVPHPGLRKSAHDLVLVSHGDGWTCVDTRLPPAVLVEGMTTGRVDGFGPDVAVEREVRYGTSRLDLRVRDPGGVWYVETKSVTLAVAGRALFPDAPTARGTRHLAELERVVAGGDRAAVAFVVQRADVDSFAPNDSTDPEFGRALRRARAGGVELWAYRCLVGPGEIKLTARVPVEL